MSAKERIGAGERNVARERLLERDDRKCTWKEPGGGRCRSKRDDSYQDRNSRGSHHGDSSSGVNAPLRLQPKGECSDALRCVSDCLQSLQILVDPDVERIFTKDVAAESERMRLVGTVDHDAARERRDVVHAHDHAGELFRGASHS